MSNMPYFTENERKTAALQLSRWKVGRRKGGTKEEVKVEYQGELYKTGNFPHIIPLMKDKNIVDASSCTCSHTIH